MKAMILGCAGTQLSTAESAFFASQKPAGLILFARNCESPAQVQGLIAQFHDAAGPDALALVDQEGGRVQRLRPPHWRALPSAARLAALDTPDAAIRTAARLCAHDLAALGITVNCAPVLDIPAPGADGIIGDRAYGVEPEIVARLGRAMAEGLLDGGVLPVIKHIPGHGRAACDSHHALPLITASLAELEADFAPFVSLRDMPLGMTAHIVLAAVDAAPVSTSARAIDRIIRGHIGFDGLLMCDDIGMHALSGPMGARAAACLEAGCDVVLHCSGDMTEMHEIALAVPPLARHAERRFRAARACLMPPIAFDMAQAEAVIGAALA